MNVLVVNAGSSSLKYQLLNTQSGEVFAKGNCERIGIDGSFIGHEEKGAGKSTLEVALPDHRTAIKHVFEILETVDAPVEGIGHRVVQGGWYFPESAVVTDETLAQVREVAPLAPLHNYAEADVIEICRDMFPELGNVIVPDTAFHYNMPERAWRYALPRDVVEKHHVRKYGAHGTSHRFIWRTVNEFMEGKAHKLVSCHLGSGASLCAIEDGHGLDLLRQGPEGGFQVQAGVPVGGRGFLLGQVLQGELLPAAEVGPAEVAGDDVEVVGRLAIVAVPVQGGEEPGEGLLGDVLPVLAVAEMVAAVPQDLGVVLSDEGLDGLVVPLVHPADQAGIWVHGSSLLSERWNRAFHPV